MLETGLSRSELLGLRWEDIDEVNHCIHVTQGLVVYHEVDEDKQVLCSDGLKNKFRKRAVPITDDTLWLRLTQAPRTVTVGNKEVLTEYIIHSPEGKAYNPNNWANRVFRPFMQRLHKEHPEIPLLPPPRAAPHQSHPMDCPRRRSLYGRTFIGPQRSEDADQDL